MSEEEKKPIELVKLDLACGQNKKEGFKGVDTWEGADIVHDLNVYPYPFENDSVDEIYCSHYVEHVADLIQFMDECYRIMKVGASMTVIAPYYSSVRAWQDPTHVRPISEASFFYYNKGWRESQKLDHYPIKSDFDFTYGYAFAHEWQNRSEEAKQFAVKHYLNVITDIQVSLKKR
jgi:SAM-dependent methyltransferase